MPIKWTTKPNEQSTMVAEVAFYDGATGGIIPKSVVWSLTDEEGNIINQRDRVAVTANGDGKYFIVLFGDDLLLPDSSEPQRVILIEAIYDSVLYGNDLPYRDEIRFSISDLLAKKNVIQATF